MDRKETRTYLDVDNIYFKIKQNIKLWKGLIYAIWWLDRWQSVLLFERILGNKLQVSLPESSQNLLNVKHYTGFIWRKLKQITQGVWFFLKDIYTYCTKRTQIFGLLFLPEHNNPSERSTFKGKRKKKERSPLPQGSKCFLFHGQEARTPDNMTVYSAGEFSPSLPYLAT